jgi:hypothetical protein
MCCFFAASNFNLFAKTPLIQVVGLATYSDVGLLTATGSSTTNIAIGLMIFVSVFCHAVADYALYRVSIFHFEVVTDRPGRGKL